MERSRRVIDMAGVSIERYGAILLLTINRTARANSLDAATSSAIDQALDQAESDPAIRAVVLTGAGDRVFCSGMDLKEAVVTGAGHGLVPGRGFAGITERRRSKVLIVAVNGVAVAGGMEIVLAADIVVAAEHATFGLSEVKRGLFAFAGGIQRLARAVPRATGLAIILTGEPITAERAFALGLISEVVSADRLLDRALAIGELIAAHDPAAVDNAKLLFDLAADAPVEASLRFGRAFGEATLDSAASRAGIAGFAMRDAS